MLGVSVYNQLQVVLHTLYLKIEKGCTAKRVIWIPLISYPRLLLPTLYTGLMITFSTLHECYNIESLETCRIFDDENVSCCTCVPAAVPLEQRYK